MGDELANCWQIMGCGRESGGQNASDLGECIASKEGVGHSCWTIAGTLCAGRAEGTTAKKIDSCMLCTVYQRYQRSIGTHGKLIKDLFPEEEKKYDQLLVERFKKRMKTPGV